jgi:hypothetical protein
MLFPELLAPEIAAHISTNALHTLIKVAIQNSILLED